MLVAKIFVSGISIRARIMSLIPEGIVGATVEFVFSSEWSSLNKTVVFRGCETKDVLNAGTTVEIPAEVVARTGRHLLVGVYGTDYDNRIAIPTLWCDLGPILDAADPSGDTSTNPTLPVWAQLNSQIPFAEVEQTEDGAAVTIKNIYGTNTVYVRDGKDGSDGRGISDVVEIDEGVLDILFTDGTMKSFKMLQGADGFSPTVDVSKSGKVTTVAITDKTGTKTATINDGADGKTGSRGNCFLLYNGKASDGYAYIADLIVPDGYTPEVGDLILCADGTVVRIADLIDEGAMDGEPTGILEAEFEPTDIILMGPQGEKGSGGSIPLTGIAVPGQMIIVKSVDEDGKPTEWEAINRTHWDDGEILPETLLEDGVTGIWGYSELHDKNVFLFNMPELAENENYIVSVDGVDYGVTCSEKSEMDLVILPVNKDFDIVQSIGGDLVDGYNSCVHLNSNREWEPIKLSISKAKDFHKLPSKYLNMEDIKSAFPTVELTATLDDGTTKTIKLYGEAVTG